MARSAEVVTVKMLFDALDSAQIHFGKAGQAERIAESVSENVEAFQMLSESATMHNESALKDCRRVQVKLVNALNESTLTVSQLREFVRYCGELNLFESGDVVVSQPQPKVNELSDKYVIDGVGVGVGVPRGKK